MIQLIRGFKDILPGEVELWQYIEQTATSLFEDFGYREIRIPIMEKTELFSRSIGEDTDIVEKEMYTFADRGDVMVTLRPEATASLCRAYIQHKLYATEPIQKLYMLGPMFRRERPQKGRYRQFYQIDAEVFGVQSPLVDVELIFMLVTLLERLNVTDANAHINSLGCPQCRPGFKEALKEYIGFVTGQLCSDCLRRRDRNPLRVLDCKVPDCREAMSKAPSLLDYLCDDCAQDFDTVQGALDRLGVSYIVDKRLVRGLDYYARTTFEIQTSALGAQSAVAGGGRYDGLVKLLGGPDQPATGFAIGFDRLAEIVALNKKPPLRYPDLFIAALGSECLEQAFDWSCALGQRGIQAALDFNNRSLKSQMKQADRSGAPWVLIFGDREREQGQAILRNMATKEQKTLALKGIVETLRNTLRT